MFSVFKPRRTLLSRFPVVCAAIILLPTILCGQGPAPLRFTRHLLDDDTRLLRGGPPAAFASDSVRAALSDAPPTWHECLTNIPGDVWEFTKISVDRESLLPLAGIGVMTAALVATDDMTYTISTRFYHDSPAAKRWSDIFVSFGDGKSQFGMGGVFGVYGLLAGDNRALRTGSQIIEVVLGAGFVVQVLKHITGRESPFVATEPTGIWRFFPNQIEYSDHVPHYDAFPSGHVCTSVATVVVIAENYPNIWWIRPVGFTLAGLVGVGMVNYGIHWYSDYPLAVAIGYLFGMIAAHPEIYRSDAHASDAVTLSIAPVVTPVQTGIGVNVRF